MLRERSEMMMEEPYLDHTEPAVRSPPGLAEVHPAWDCLWLDLLLLPGAPHHVAQEGLEGGLLLSRRRLVLHGGQDGGDNCRYRE